MVKTYLQSIYVLNYVMVIFLGVLRALDIYSTWTAITSGLAYELNPLAVRFFEEENITELILLNLVLLLGLLLLNYYAYTKDSFIIVFAIFMTVIVITIYTYIIVYQNFLILNAVN